MEEIFQILTEATLNKIEQKIIEVRQHPGIKIGKEKYITQQSSFDQNVEQDSVIKISEKPSIISKSRYGGGKNSIKLS